MTVFEIVTWGVPIIIMFISIFLHSMVSQTPETKSDAMVTAILFCLFMPLISILAIPIADTFVSDEIKRQEEFGALGNGLITVGCVLIVGFVHNILIVINSVRFYKRNHKKKS